MHFISNVVAFPTYVIASFLSKCAKRMRFSVIISIPASYGTKLMIFSVSNPRWFIQKGACDL